MRDLGRAIDSIDENKVDPLDVVLASDGDSESLDAKVHNHKNSMAKLEAAKTRLQKCQSANDVFSDFSKDAAIGKVTEMFIAKNSTDRQRAQETILDRALGKAVDRTMSINAQVSNEPDGVLDERIRQLNAELGYTAGEGSSTSLLIEGEGDKGPEEADRLQAEPGISGEVLQE